MTELSESNCRRGQKVDGYNTISVSVIGTRFQLGIGWGGRARRLATLKFVVQCRSKHRC